MDQKTKVYVYNRQINGRFDSFKTKVKRFFAAAVLCAQISSAALAIFFLGAFTFSTNRSEAYMVNVMPQKVAELKADVITRLAACESAGHKESDGIIIFDSNKVASIGQLQFQVKTVQYYYKKLYSQDITAKEATLIALDYEKASKLATDIIFREGGNPEKDWYICSKKLGLAAEVKVLNKLD